MHWIIPSHTLIVPNITGLSVVNGIKKLTAHQLPALIFEHTEDSTVKEPIITQQIPLEGTAVKPQHPIFISIVEPLHKALMPSCTYPRTTSETASLMCKKIVMPCFSRRVIPSSSCIAQFPSAGMPLEDTYYCYVTEPEHLYLAPDCVGQQVYNAESLLKKYGIKCTFHQQKSRHHPTLQDTAYIIDQEPKAGSIFSLKNPPAFHFTLAS